VCIPIHKVLRVSEGVVISTLCACEGHQHGPAQTNEDSVDISEGAREAAEQARLNEPGRQAAMYCRDYYEGEK
jgi:hypothetical protein